jgi:hypothetical protein
LSYNINIAGKEGAMNIKWVLSEECRDCPKCGPRGTNDMFGLGPGVYPRDRFPKFPAHFGCDCTRKVLSD